jgi:hypothetical protein
MESSGQQILYAKREEAAPRRRLGLRGLIQVAIGAGALILIIARSDGNLLWEALRSTEHAYLPLAVAATLGVNWLMAYRWGVILRVRGHRLKTRRLFIYYLIGIFFMNCVPGGGLSSDVARLIYADREVRDKPFVLSTLVYERLVGLFTLLSIGFVASAMLMSDYFSSRLARLARSLGTRFRLERAGGGAARALEAISELRRHRKMLAATLGLSVVIRLVWGLGWFVVVQAMGLPLGLPVVFAFVSLVDLIRMLPISVGGLGVREWAIVALFAGAGIGREQALMFSFLAFAPMLLNAIVGGIIYTSRAWLIPQASEPEQ